jgi:GT2 family glycosyltransferase
MSQLKGQNCPSVGIIIINWNSFSVTTNCLRSLRFLNYPNFEVIVVDNGSDDDSIIQLKSSYPEITLLKSLKNEGFTGGNNIGLKYGLGQRHDYLMLLNNDTVVTHDLLKILINVIDKNDLIAAIQPKIMYNHDRKIIWNAGGSYNSFLSLTSTRGEGQVDNGQFDVQIETDWITGCCFLIRSEIVKKIGFLDERYFIYHEDADWSMKVQELGLKMLYEPKAIIYHDAGMSDLNREKHNEGNVSPFSHYMGVKNHILFVRRHANGINIVGSWSYQVFKLVGYTTYFVIRGRFKKLKAVLKGIIDGLTL